jgi:hypothetical protein
MKIYVASSWRNPIQPDVVKALRDAGHEVYDFRNPAEGDNGFSWRTIDDRWGQWTTTAYLEGLKHPLAVEGFRKDFDAMKWADAFVLVLPCGRRAHLEAGWAIGYGKPMAILLAEGEEPELMNLLATALLTCIPGLVEWANSKEVPCKSL